MFLKGKALAFFLGKCFERGKVKDTNTKHSLYFLYKTFPLKKTCMYKVHNFCSSEFFRNIPPKPCRKVLAKFLSVFPTKDALRNLVERLQGRAVEHAWNREGSVWMLWSHGRMKRNIYYSCHLTNDLGGICNDSDWRLATSVLNTH